MPLRGIELRRVRLPLVHPHGDARGTQVERDVVVVRVETDDGRTGWGECPTLSAPTYIPEYTDGEWRLLVDLLVPSLLGGAGARPVGHAPACWAIDTALADVRAQAHGCPLSSLWAGPAGARGRVASTAVVGLERDLDQLHRRVAAALELGHRSVKVKIDPTWLVEPLTELRATWPDLDLSADANGSLAECDDRDYDAVEALGLAYLEQPLAPDDLTGSAALAARLRTPVVLDESVTSSGAVATIVALGAADGVNAKPGRLGRESIAVARAAHDSGLEVLCGGMLETGIGRAAALAVAALPAFTLPADLGPSTSYFERDLTEPFDLDARGTLEVPGGVGLGVVPDPQHLDVCTVEQVWIGR